MVVDFPGSSDDDFDPFADDAAEDAVLAEVERVAEEQRKKKEEKAKAEGKSLVEKSRVVFDVKVVDEEVDLDALREKILKELEIPKVEYQGYSIQPVFGPLNKLRIIIDIEDTVCVEEIFESLQDKFEDEIQSIDIWSFNKL